MVKESMDEILQAEQRAEEVTLAATERAKEIRRQGEETSAAIVAEGKKSAAELLISLEKETEAAAAKEEAFILEKGREEAAAIRRGAEGKVTDAAKQVKDRLLKKYGVAAL